MGKKSRLPKEPTLSNIDRLRKRRNDYNNNNNNKLEKQKTKKKGGGGGDDETRNKRYIGLYYTKLVHFNYIHKVLNIYT